MTPGPVSTRPEIPLQRALESLVRERLGALPVVDRDGAIVGVLGERELLRAFAETGAATVADVMDPGPQVVDLDDPVVHVADLLMANDMRRVLVSRDGMLVGIVTRGDLMPAILDALAERAREPETRR